MNDVSDPGGVALDTPITPTAEQRDAFVTAAGSVDDGPVVMANLLAFTKGEQEDRYMSSYGTPVVAMVAEVGGTYLWMGKVNRTFIGDPGQDWDYLVLAWYPSRTAFLDMVQRPDYLSIHETGRESGLAATMVLDVTELYRNTQPLPGS